MDEIPLALLEHISQEVFHEWLAQLNRHCVPRSLNRKLSVIKSFYHFLYRLRYIKHNPAVDLTLPKYTRTLPVYLTQKQLNEFLDSLPEDTYPRLRNKVMLELLYGCGLRRSELARLRYEDIKMEKRCLWILGKGNKRRIVPFTKRIAALLEKYFNYCDQHGIDYKRHLFVNKWGKPIGDFFIYRMVKKYPELSGISPHVLRHSYATHLLEKGADLDVIRDLLGHSTLATTEVYLQTTLRKLYQVYSMTHPRAKKDIKDVK